MPVKSYYVQTALSNFHSTGPTLRLPAQGSGQDTGQRACVESLGSRKRPTSRGSGEDTQPQIRPTFSAPPLDSVEVDKHHHSLDLFRIVATFTLLIFLRCLCLYGLYIIYSRTH